MTKIGDLSLQVYVGGVGKDNIGQMNADQQLTDKATDIIGKLPAGPLTGPPAKSGPFIPSNHGGHVASGKLKTLYKIIRFEMMIIWRIRQKVK